MMLEPFPLGTAHDEHCWCRGCKPPFTGEPRTRSMEDLLAIAAAATGCWLAVLCVAVVTFF